MKSLRYLLLLFVCFKPFCLYSVELSNIFKFKVKSKRVESNEKIKKFSIEIESNIKEGYYVYSKEFKIEFKPQDSVNVLDKIFPKPVKHFDNFLGAETEIYRGQNSFKIYIALETGENKSFPLAVEITYRGCSKTICYLTQTERFNVNLDPADSLSTGRTSSLDTWLRRGFLLAMLAAFLAGIISSLTPCVYPIIPVVIALVVANRQRSKGFALTSTFTLGLALVYSILGLVAARSGIFVGSLMQSVYLLSFVSLVFFAMGLSLIGLYEIKLPHKMIGKLSSLKGQGYLGALLTGMVTGIVAIPCVGPFAGSVLALAAKSSSLTKGFSLLLSFSFGMGILFIVLGTFSSLALRLPKPGAWMITLKKISGIILILTSLYFVRFALPSSLVPFLAFVTLVVISIAFKITSKKDPVAGRNDARISRVALIIAVIVLLASTFSNRFRIPSGKNYEHDESVAWNADEGRVLSDSRTGGKNVLIDFYADWCESCGELDRYTFRDLRVIERSKDFIFLRIDLSKTNTQNDAVARKYSVMGLPSLIFLCPNGKEAKDSRITGFINPDKLLRHMDDVKKGCLSKK